MLDHCAPGHTRRTTDHHIRISYRGKTYPSLPLGPHGRGRSTGRALIFLGHVRQLVGQLEIDSACAWECIENLYS